MKAAKTLVWVMTGMLVALLGVLVVGLSLGWHKDDEAASSLSGNPENQSVDFRSTDILLDEPAGTKIESVTQVGGFVGLTLSGGGQPPRVVFIDPATGSMVARIRTGQGTTATEPSE